jgi:hypothetical protein
LDKRALTLLQGWINQSIGFALVECGEELFLLSLKLHLLVVGSFIPEKIGIRVISKALEHILSRL